MADCLDDVLLEDDRNCSGFPTKNLLHIFMSPMRATCPALLILDFIIVITFCEAHRS